MFEVNEFASMAAALEESGEFRVLRRLNFDGVPDPEQAQVGLDFQLDVGLAIDLETTGVDLATDSIIELAARRFWVNHEGEIVALGESYSWFEDPGVKLSPAIARLTGLSDADLAFEEIDEEAIASLVAGSDFLVAHNAAFDRRFFEQRFPNLGGRPWACTCREIDWSAHGFDGRGLNWLLAQCGWFHDGAHRAGADVDALIALLRQPLSGGVVAAQELLATARKSSCLVRAKGAHFEVRGALRARGYRWCAAESVWRREIPVEARAEEEAWLAFNVYAPRHRPTAREAVFSEMTWRERHA